MTLAYFGLAWTTGAIEVECSLQPNQIGQYKAAVSKATVTEVVAYFLAVGYKRFGKGPGVMLDIFVKGNDMKAMLTYIVLARGCLNFVVGILARPLTPTINEAT